MVFEYFHKLIKFRFLGLLLWREYLWLLLPNRYTLPMMTSFPDAVHLCQKYSFDMNFSFQYNCCLIFIKFISTRNDDVCISSHFISFNKVSVWAVSKHLFFITKKKRNRNAFYLSESFILAVLLLLRDLEMPLTLSNFAVKIMFQLVGMTSFG